MRKYICEECKKLENPPPVKDCYQCIRAKAKIWYNENRHKYKAWREKYRTENREKYLESKKRYFKKHYSLNKDYWQKKNKYWYLKHPEKNREKRKRYYSKNRESILKRELIRKSKTRYGEFWEAHRMLRELEKRLKKEKRKWQELKEVRTKLRN